VESLRHGGPTRLGPVKFGDARGEGVLPSGQSLQVRSHCRNCGSDYAGLGFRRPTHDISRWVSSKGSTPKYFRNRYRDLRQTPALVGHCPHDSGFLSSKARRQHQNYQALDTSSFEHERTIRARTAFFLPLRRFPDCRGSHAKP